MTKPNFQRRFDHGDKALKPINELTLETGPAVRMKMGRLTSRRLSNHEFAKMVWYQACRRRLPVEFIQAAHACMIKAEVDQATVEEERLCSRFG